MDPLLWMRREGFGCSLKAFSVVSRAAGFDVRTSASCKSDLMYKRW